jgi:hypothetical protein
MRSILRDVVFALAVAAAIGCEKNVRDPYAPSNAPKGEEVPANSANEAPPPKLKSYEKTEDKPDDKSGAEDRDAKDARPDRAVKKEGKKDEKKDGPRRATQAECDEALNQFLILSGFSSLPPGVIADAKKQALRQAGGADPCKSLSHDEYICMMGAQTPDQWKSCQPRKTR